MSAETDRAANALRDDLATRLEALADAPEAQDRQYFGVVAYMGLDDACEIILSAGAGRAPEAPGPPLTADQLDRTWTPDASGHVLPILLRATVPGQNDEPLLRQWVAATSPWINDLRVPLDDDDLDRIGDFGFYERLWHGALRPAIELAQERRRASGDTAPWLLWHAFGALGGWDTGWIISHNRAEAIEPLRPHLAEHRHPTPPRHPSTFAP